MIKRPKIYLLAAILILVGGAIFLYLSSQRLPGAAPVTSISDNEPLVNNSNKMTITSPAFVDNQIIPAKYSCDGQGINPPLVFGDVPANAKSLALILNDPDAPGGDFVHWLIWNIDPATQDIKENAVPVGAVQGTNSANNQSYVGPCPPSGTHHYHLKLYALDTNLQLNPSAKKSDLEKAMEGHILEKMELIGLYSR